MVSREDIESFLDRMTPHGAQYSEVESGLWVVKPGGALDINLIVHYSPPVVIMRVKIMSLPSGSTLGTRLFRRLLELNATELLHGAYGIEGDSVVMTETLELSHLDFEEFLASYESMTLALSAHLRELGSLQEVA
jgi:hypothetical protein